MKNTLEGFNSRRINNEMKDRMVNITAEEQNKEKRIKELRTISETSEKTLNTPTFKL